MSAGRRNVLALAAGAATGAALAEVDLILSGLLGTRLQPVPDGGLLSVFVHDEQEVELIRFCRAHPERVGAAIRAMGRLRAGVPADDVSALYLSEVAEVTP